MCPVLSFTSNYNDAILDFSFNYRLESIEGQERMRKRKLIGYQSYLVSEFKDMLLSKEEVVNTLVTGLAYAQ